MASRSPLQRHRAAALLLMAGLSAPNAAQADIDCRPLRSSYEGRDLFLQHNLRFSDDEASWVNYVLTGDYLAVGTPVRVHKVKEDEVILIVGGRDSKLSLDLGDAQPGCQVLLDRLLGEEPPDLSTLSELDRKAIERAAIEAGMTRRAVILAVGYPPHYYAPPFVGDDKNAVNHDPNADVLTYMGSRWDFIRVTFRDDIVVEIGD